VSIKLLLYAHLNI